MSIAICQCGRRIDTDYEEMTDEYVCEECMKPAPYYVGQPGYFGNAKWQCNDFGNLHNIVGGLFVDFCNCSKWNYFVPSTNPLDGGWFVNEGRPDIELPEGATLLGTRDGTHVWPISMYFHENTWDLCLMDSYKYWRIEPKIEFLEEK